MNKTVTECPLCIRIMDDMDQAFLPCPCGYQVCMFCYKRMLEMDPRCPGCRSTYDKNEVAYVDPSNNSNNNKNDGTSIGTKASANANSNNNSNSNNGSNNKKTKGKRDSSNDISDNNSNHESGHSGHSGPSHIHLSFDQMAEIRVRQKNLVYVVGLPVKELDEVALKSSKWFGRFGKIKKVYCNKKTSHAARTGSFAAFITYYNQKDALNAISAMNGLKLDEHRQLRATTGSTKYCSYFLRGQNCTNPQCLYLHDWAKDEDVVTKEELNDFGPVTAHLHGPPTSPVTSATNAIPLKTKSKAATVLSNTSSIKKSTGMSGFDYTKKKEVSSNKVVQSPNHGSYSQKAQSKSMVTPSPNVSSVASVAPIAPPAVPSAMHHSQSQVATNGTNAANAANAGSLGPSSLANTVGTHDGAGVTSTQIVQAGSSSNKISQSNSNVQSMRSSNASSLVPGSPIKSQPSQGHLQSSAIASMGSSGHGDGHDIHEGHDVHDGHDVHGEYEHDRDRSASSAQVYYDDINDNMHDNRSSPRRSAIGALSQTGASSVSSNGQYSSNYSNGASMSPSRQQQLQQQPQQQQQHQLACKGFEDELVIGMPPPGLAKGGTAAAAPSSIYSHHQSSRSRTYSQTDNSSLSASAHGSPSHRYRMIDNGSINNSSINNGNGNNNNNNNNNTTTNNNNSSMIGVDHNGGSQPQSSQQTLVQPTRPPLPGNVSSSYNNSSMNSSMSRTNHIRKSTRPPLTMRTNNNGILNSSHHNGASSYMSHGHSQNHGHSHSQSPPSGPLRPPHTSKTPSPKKSKLKQQDIASLLSSVATHRSNSNSNSNSASPANLVPFHASMSMSPPTSPPMIPTQTVSNANIVPSVPSVPQVQRQHSQPIEYDARQLKTTNVRHNSEQPMQYRNDVIPQREPPRPIQQKVPKTSSTEKQIERERERERERDEMEERMARENEESNKDNKNENSNRRHLMKPPMVSGRDSMTLENYKKSKHISDDMVKSDDELIQSLMTHSRKKRETNEVSTFNNDNDNDNDYNNNKKKRKEENDNNDNKSKDIVSNEDEIENNIDIDMSQIEMEMEMENKNEHKMVSGIRFEYEAKQNRKMADNLLCELQMCEKYGLSSNDENGNENEKKEEMQDLVSCRQLFGRGWITSSEMTIPLSDCYFAQTDDWIFSQYKKSRCLVFPYS